MNEDFETFKNNKSWFFETSDKIDFLYTENELQLSETFKKTFPLLTELLRKARILKLKINEQLYQLFSWTNKDGFSCGWLNKIEENTGTTFNLIKEHELLLSEIGGIQESYNQPEPGLSNNQNFMFIQSECFVGIGGCEETYEEICNEENKQPIDFNDLICFVEEANGNMTLYNPENKEVLLFAGDHCFDNVEILENQPAYTFYKINNVTTFVDYVETLATEWKNEIK
jgi:hypothetical protein